MTPLQAETASERADTVNTVVSAQEDEALPSADGTAGTPTFPEGGLRGWATVAGAFIIQFCGFGYTTSFGVYQDFYVRDYLSTSTSSAISWIGSVNAFIVIAGGLLAGRLFDRGHFYLLMRGGCLLLTFSLFMLSLCKPEKYYQIFLAQALGAGLGAGIIYVPSIAVVSHYFQKRRALAMSIVASGSSLGAVVHPIMLNNTFRSLGFGNAVRASAGLIGGLLLIACVLMHPRLPPPQTHLPLWKSVKRFCVDVPYVLAVLALTIFTVGFYFPLFYLQLDAVKHGLDETFSFYALVIMNASSFFGRLSPGFLANRFGVVNVGAAASGGGAVLILCMIALRTVASVLCIGIIYGFFAGIFVTMMAPLMAVLTENMEEFGLRMGFGFFIVAFGGLIGPPINGALLTGRFIWWRPALFSGIMAFIGFAFFVATAVVVRRRDSKKKRAIEKANAEDEKI